MILLIAWSRRHTSPGALVWGIFWGDHFAGLATPIEVLLILSFALLLRRMFRQALPEQPVAVSDRSLSGSRAR